MNNTSIVAQQKINSMFANQTGPEAQLKTIRIIMALSVVFGIVSIIGSAAGFNYDFMIFFPSFSLASAIMLAIALEASRLAFIYGFFSFKDFLLKALFATGMIIMTVLAIILHLRGMDSMAIVETNKSIREVLSHNQKIDMMNQQRADKLLTITGEAQKVVLNNGSKYDDKLMVKSMRENTSLITTLSASKQITSIQAKYLNAQKSQAKILKKVGSIVLPLVELFALFGFLAAFLKTRAVSTDVKEIVDAQNSVNAIKATALPQALPHEEKVKAYADEIKQNIYKQLEPTSNSTKELKDSQNTEKPHTVDPQADQKSTQNLKNNINLQECENDEEVGGYKEQEAKKTEELFTVNLMVYPNSHNEVIKTMFDYGNIKQGHYLVDKTEVLKKLHLSKREYETVANDLVKNKHITFIKGKGYLALSDLENEVKTA